MVVMNLHCSRIELNHKYVNNTIANQCLRVKVKGRLVNYIYSSTIYTYQHSAFMNLVIILLNPYEEKRILFVFM